MNIVILAAGKGTRMKSALPKVLHPVGGQSMLSRVVRTALQFENPHVVVVVGHGADEVRQALANFDVVELDARIATAAADIRFRSRMKLMDAYILATAQVNGGILITRNIKDFPANVPGIRVPYIL